MRAKSLVLVMALHLFGSFAILAQDKKQSPAASQRRQIGGAVTRGENGVPPWRLSDDERMERRAKSFIAGSRAGALSAGSRYVDHVNGRDTPELFLPFELFDYLVDGLDAHLARGANARKAFDAGIASLGYDTESFWGTLGAASGPYRQSILVANPAGKYVWRGTRHCKRGARGWEEKILIAFFMRLSRRRSSCHRAAIGVRREERISFAT